MVTGNYPAMNRRMKVCKMPMAAAPILAKFRTLLTKAKGFNCNDLIGSLSIACNCSGQRTTMEMMSVLWHATKDPVLVYYFDNVENQSPEFQFYVAQAYGVKKNRRSSLDVLRSQYWESFYVSNSVKRSESV